MLERILHYFFPNFHPTRWEWFRKFLYWFVALIRPKIIKIKYGFKLKVAKRDKSDIQYFLWKDKCYEEENSEKVLQLLKPNNVAIDVGANIGYFSCLFAQIVGPQGKVIAFEPESKNFDLLKHNVKLNNFDNVSCYKMAISDQNAETKIYISEEHCELHSLIEQPNAEYQIISTQSLDSFVMDNDLLRGKSIDLVKIDAEGYELKVLKGMKNLLSKGNVENIFIEYSPHRIIATKDDPLEFFEIFKNIEHEVEIAVLKCWS